VKSKSASYVKLRFLKGILNFCCDSEILTPSGITLHSVSECLSSLMHLSLGFSRRPISITLISSSFRGAFSTYKTSMSISSSSSADLSLFSKCDLRFLVSLVSLNVRKEAILYCGRSFGAFMTIMNSFSHPGLILITKLFTRSFVTGSSMNQHFILISELTILVPSTYSYGSSSLR